MKSNKPLSQTKIIQPEDMLYMIENYVEDCSVKTFDGSVITTTTQNLSPEIIKEIASQVSDILSVSSNKDIIAHYVDLKIKYDDLEKRFQKVEKCASEYMKENKYLRNKFEEILLF